MSPRVAQRVWFALFSTSARKISRLLSGTTKTCRVQAALMSCPIRLIRLYPTWPSLAHWRTMANHWHAQQSSSLERPQILQPLVSKVGIWSKSNISKLLEMTHRYLEVLAGLRHLNICSKCLTISYFCSPSRIQKNVWTTVLWRHWHWRYGSRHWKQACLWRVAKSWLVSAFTDVYYLVADVPYSFPALTSSCVLIPCSFQSSEVLSRGMWSKINGDNIYHNSKSNVLNHFKGRTKMPQDLSKGDCSLEIDDIRPFDSGPFCFHGEKGNDKYRFNNSCVFIVMKGMNRSLNLVLLSWDIYLVGHSLTNDVCL